VRDLAVLLPHLLATIARLAGPGGARSVVAESVLAKHQLLILNRSRKRSPKLRLSDRMIAGLCALLIRPSRLIRSAIVLKPSTLLRLHRALTTRKYRWLFSAKWQRSADRREMVAAVVDMKRRNPTWGCPRIAQQIVLAFGIAIDKDVVRRILARQYRPRPDSGGPSWLTVVLFHNLADVVSVCLGYRLELVIDPATLQMVVPRKNKRRGPRTAFRRPVPVGHGERGAVRSSSSPCRSPCPGAKQTRGRDRE
jgi:putative transposase